MKDIYRRMASLALCFAIVIQAYPYYKKIKSEKIKNKFDMISYVDGSKRAELLSEDLQENLSSIANLGLNDSLDLKDEEIDECISSSNGNVCGKHFDIAADEVISQIKENTANYLLEYPNDDVTSFFDEDYFTRETFKNYYGIPFDEYIMNKIKEDVYRSFKEQISYILRNGTDEDIHNLMDLKMFFTEKLTSSTNDAQKLSGNFSHDVNILRICLPNISSWVINYSDMALMLDSVIKHELNHACQSACPDVLENQGLSMIKLIDGKPFFIESSAESALYNLNMQDKVQMSNTNYTYLKYRKQESAMLLCSLFNKYTINDYYQAINNQDLNSLLNFLGAETDEEKREIFRVLYAIDATDERNSYVKRIVGKKDTYTDDDYTKLSNKLNNLQYITIFRIVINNLINYNINKSDLTLDDNIWLYRMIADVISTGAFRLFSSEKNDVYYTYDEFVQEFKIIQDSFFDALSTIYKVSDEEIRALYEDYKDLSLVAAFSLIRCNQPAIYVINNNTYNLSDELNKLIKKFPKINEIFGNTYLHTDIEIIDTLEMLDSASKGSILVKKKH